jgi:hypothetical protein
LRNRKSRLSAALSYLEKWFYALKPFLALEMSLLALFLEIKPLVLD